MKKIIFLFLIILLLTPSALATKLNFRGKEASSLSGEPNGTIQRISFSLSVNDEAGFKPVSEARGSMTLTTAKRDRVSIRMKKTTGITTDNNITIVSFEKAMIKINTKEETCKTYSNGRIRCRKKYVTKKLTEDVEVIINFENKSISLLSDSVQVYGITGKYIECIKLPNGRRHCTSYVW